VRVSGYKRVEVSVYKRVEVSGYKRVRVSGYKRVRVSMSMVEKQQIHPIIGSSVYEIRRVEKREIIIIQKMYI